jgi:hypothetical protein
MEPEDPRLSAAARHALHDEELVAAFAVDGDAADDPARARQLIERCQTCRDLHADIVAIGAVVRAVGSAEALGAVRRAPRDFRLTASDAVRILGGNGLQRLAARLRDGIATFGRPVGASLAALGVVGLLVGTMSLGGLGGSPASMPIEGTGGAAPGATSGLGAVNQPEASAAEDRSTSAPEPSGERQVFTTTGTDSGLTAPGGSALLLAGSITLLVAGAALLLGGSRRRRHVPARNRAGI